MYYVMSEDKNRAGCYYSAIPEERHHADIGDYNTYGIKLICPGFEQTIHDVTLHEETASSLASLFNMHQLDPVHFFDAVLDFICSDY